jgi:CRP/FNR family transcriptional regulator, anaerobic regulatory protein
MQHSAPLRLELQRELALGRQALIARFEAGSSRVLNPAELLIAGANQDEVLYRLRLGWTYRSYDLADERTAIVDVHVPGEILGFDTVPCERRNANIRTLTIAVIEIITAERGILELLTGATGLCIWRLLSERQQRADRLVATISSLDARGRIAAMVLDFYQRLTTRKLITTRSFNLPLTQHQIANFLGMTAVHVNRTIRAMSNDQLLRIEKQHVTILDLGGLANLAKANVEPG